MLLVLAHYRQRVFKLFENGILILIIEAMSLMPHPKANTNGQAMLMSFVENCTNIVRTPSPD